MMGRYLKFIVLCLTSCVAIGIALLTLAYMPFFEKDQPRLMCKLVTEFSETLLVQVPNSPFDGFRVRLYFKGKQEDRWQEFFLDHDAMFGFLGELNPVGNTISVSTNFRERAVFDPKRRRLSFGGVRSFPPLPGLVDDPLKPKHEVVR
jgi:hypothetical protein